MNIELSTLVTAAHILRSANLKALPISHALKLNRLINEVSPAIQMFEERRLDIAKRHGTLSEDKRNYNFETDEAKEAFQEELKGLLAEEVEINVAKIEPEILDEVIQIEPANVKYVEWFLDI